MKKILLRSKRTLFSLIIPVILMYSHPAHALGNKFFAAQVGDTISASPTPTPRNTTTFDCRSYEYKMPWLQILSVTNAPTGTIVFRPQGSFDNITFSDLYIYKSAGGAATGLADTIQCVFSATTGQFVTGKFLNDQAFTQGFASGSDPMGQAGEFLKPYPFVRMVVINRGATTNTLGSTMTYSIQWGGSRFETY